VSEDKEYLCGEWVEEPYELTLPQAVCAALCGFVLGALLYPFTAKADPTYRSADGYVTLVPHSEKPWSSSTRSCTSLAPTSGEVTCA
jgi:hypothetical protein